MHPSALQDNKYFFDAYADCFPKDYTLSILEIGSQDVNGSLRANAPATATYVGVDFVEGKGVDLVLTDPYQIPVDDRSVDIVLCSSCFEHSELFWLTFLEGLRILKPRGLFYLNVPSNGQFHRYPVDCWRFYPDSGRALVTWAKRNGIQAALLESYIGHQNGDPWNDFVAIFLKDDTFVSEFPKRILDTKKDFNNGIVHGKDDFLNMRGPDQNQTKLDIIGMALSNQLTFV